MRSRLRYQSIGPLKPPFEKASTYSWKWSALIQGGRVASSGTVEMKVSRAGVPVWLATQGSALNQQKLVLAQDTGGAIVGAVRADLFTGWGGWTDPAYQLAGRLKQPLQLWALWPR